MITKIQKITILIICISSALYAQSKDQNTIDVDSLSRRFKLDISYNDISGDVILADKKFQLKIIPGMSQFELNLKTYELPRPISVSNGQIFMDRKVLDYLVQKQQTPVAKESIYPKVLPKDFTVVIDPGHGGKDPGTSGENGVLEKKVALTVSLMVKDELEHMGATVVMTRVGDVFIPLPERPLVASTIGSDLFISIHLNSAKDTTVEGVEVFVYRFREQEYENSRSDSMTQNISFKKSLLVDDCYISMGMENEIMRLQLFSCVEQSQKLASRILSNVLEGGSISSRGIKEANFVVLRNATCPSVLIEMGFLSHAETESKFQTNAYCKLMANRIANGIAKYWKEK